MFARRSVASPWLGAPRIRSSHLASGPACHAAPPGPHAHGARFAVCISSHFTWVKTPSHWEPFWQFPLEADL